MKKIILKYNNGSVPPQYSISWQLDIDNAMRGRLVYNSVGNRKLDENFELGSFAWTNIWNQILNLKEDGNPEHFVGGPQYFFILISDEKEVVNKLLREPNKLWQQIITSVPEHITEKIATDN